MADAHGPSRMDTPVPGQASLGPHVVGLRIVVRRVLRGETGPSGGPALTDLLGTCLAWTDDACVVQPESGPAVTVALADIVSGKPVPPRPSVRHRVGVRDAEAHTSALWPALERVSLGDWEMRCDPAPSGRLLKRANSCLAMGDPGRPVSAALAAVGSFYAERARDPLVQVEAGSDIEDAVASAGWEQLPQGESAFLLVSLARARRMLGSVSGSVDLSADGPRALARVGVGGDIHAVGQAGVDGDWIGLHGVTVDEAHRRQGRATTIVGALLEWGAEQGAMTAWLHVETDNPGGRAFWESLGFTEHHTCRYYGAPSSSDEASPDSASPVSR